MNYTALMNYISRLLHTAVRRFDRDFIETDYICARQDFDDSTLSADIIFYCQKLNDTIPILLDVNSRLVYGWVPDCGGAYLVGPVCFASPIFFTRSVQTAAISDTFLAQIAVCDFQDTISALLLIYNLHHSAQLDQNTFIQHSCVPEGSEAEPLKLYSEIVFKNQEYGQKHNPYAQELREQKGIELGDLELLKKSIEEDYTGTLGTLSKDSLRNEKYLGAAVLTLASRSAIRGGITPEVAFSLQDSYMQKIDECSSAPLIRQLIRNAEYTFAGIVQEQKDFRAGSRAKENPCIERCKEYVFSHLHDKLEVADIARYLTLNANYLSEIFRVSEGITLKSYIQHEKIKLVKNLLIYSHYGYSEIATYLGFSSQSHLGKIFKQETGYTLSQYRREFGSPEFN